MSDAQKRQLWDRWKAGASISEISRALGKPGPVFTVIRSTGGFVTRPRSRREGSLTASDRESIFRGLARGDSLRKIARELVSTTAQN